MWTWRGRTRNEDRLEARFAQVRVNINGRFIRLVAHYPHRQYRVESGVKEFRYVVVPEIMGGDRRLVQIHRLYAVGA